MNDVNAIDFKKLQKIIKRDFGLEVFPTKDQFKKLKSKRNTVYSVIMPNYGIRAVIKIFEQSNKEEALSNELMIYRKLAPKNYILDEQLLIPELLSSGTNYLITKFVDGRNLMDIVSNQIKLINFSDRFWRDLFYRMIQWIKVFQEKTNILQDDIHIRNFIIGGKRGDGLYGLDFEELINDNINDKNKIELLTSAYCKLLFSILASKPGIIEDEFMEYKMKLCVSFFQSLLKIFDNFNFHLYSESVKYILKKFKSVGKTILERRMKLNIINSDLFDKTMVNFDNTVKLIKEKLLKNLNKF